MWYNDVARKGWGLKAPEDFDDAHNAHGNQCKGSEQFEYLQEKLVKLSDQLDKLFHFVFHVFTSLPFIYTTEISGCQAFFLK